MRKEILCFGDSNTWGYDADAGEWGVELCADGIHYTIKGHETFAREIYSVIKNIAEIKQGGNNNE